MIADKQKPFLKIDHLKLNLFDHFLGILFIGVNAVFQFSCGLIRLKIRERMTRNCQETKIRLNSVDYDKLLGEYLLEGMRVIHFKEIITEPYYSNGWL